MKLKFFYLLIMALTALSACAPQEFDDYSLGSTYTIASDAVHFSMTRGADDFTYDYAASVDEDAAKKPYSYEIRFGDGSTTRTLTGNHEYIVAKGVYTAQFLVYVPGGDVIVKERSLTFAEDNEKIYQDDPTSVQYALTGGKDNENGKEWKLSYSSGLYNPANLGELWWNFNAESAMFDDEFTFKPNSIKPNGAFAHDTKGGTFINEALGALFPDGDTDGSFITANYNPPADATWEVTQSGGKNYLTIKKGFLGYAVLPEDLTQTTYEVLSHSATEIRCLHSTASNAWVFVLTSAAANDPLTGAGAKTWVVDANNASVSEVAAATGLNIKGHIGLGPQDSYGQEWWAAGPQDKAMWTLYDWTLSFSAAKTLTITTKGEGYGRKAFDGETFTSTYIDGDDMTFPYSGGSYTYTYVAGTPYAKLTLSGNAFTGYYAGSQEYEVLYLSETAMALCVHDVREGQDWVFLFVSAE